MSHTLILYSYLFLIVEYSFFNFEILSLAIQKEMVSAELLRFEDFYRILENRSFLLWIKSSRHMCTTFFMTKSVKEYNSTYVSSQKLIGNNK